MTNITIENKRKLKREHVNEWRKNNPERWAEITKKAQEKRKNELKRLREVRQVLSNLGLIDEALNLDMVKLQQIENAKEGDK